MSPCRLIGEWTERAGRVVSLAPSLTETFYLLGLGDRLAGATLQCDYPPEAARLEKVGTFARPDRETIRTLGADLVVGLDRFHCDLAGQLAEIGIPTLLFDYRTVEDILVSMEKLAQMTEAGNAVRARVDGFRARVERMQEEMKGRTRCRVFRLMTDDPLVTPSDNCYQSDVIRLAGGETMPLALAEPYVPVSTDEVLEFDPQVVVSCGLAENEAPKPRCVGCQATNRICLRDVRALYATSVWPETTAGKNKAIFAVPCGFLCRPGPRTIDAVEKLSQLFASVTGS